MDDNNMKQNEQAEAASVEQDIQAVEDKIAARKKKIRKELKEWVVALGAAVIVVLIINTFLFRLIRVDGTSMNTTLASGERLFVTVPDVKFGEPQRGEVVICHYPNRGMTYFVKRLVALPGDTVYRENGVTHVVYEEDGEPVDLALDSEYARLRGLSVSDYEPYVLGEDEYFVVGDNRYNSHDSRDWNGFDGDPSNDVGPISKKMIVGHVREVIWPLNKIRPVETDMFGA